MSDALTEYEEVCRDAQDAGVNIVTKEFTNNWDYIQSCFFALTILTTIGAVHFYDEHFYFEQILRLW